MEKQTINLTIFLIKDYFETFDECLKSPTFLTASTLKPSYGMDGAIYYCDSNKKVPRWKTYLDQLGRDSISISENASNKAIILAKVNDRIMAIVFGYGRSFLKEECIERNFGLKVALNTINPNKMRSVNAATIEDMVVNTQRQASYSTSQDEFGLNVTNDIMKGITGEPYDKIYGNNVSGKDSLVVSVLMDLSELKDKLLLYYNAYKGERYKNIGFDWVDNVAEVRDSLLSEMLDDELATAIKNRKTEHLHIAPPETTDWDHIIGFCYSGIHKDLEKHENYSLDLDVSEYISKINDETKVIPKLHRDRLYAMNSDGTPFTICNIYSALTFQTEYEGKNYILCSASWYQVEKSFFTRVNKFIQENIPVSTVDLPDCPKNCAEGDYNQMAASGNSDYCLMDCELVSVNNGPKKIEACDIFTRNKQFIHVKNKSQSSQLSHLFAQGRISAECFISDEEFRKQISDKAEVEFGYSLFDFSVKPNTNEYEVVYAIIDDKESDLVTKLPFFSKVNLMLTVQELDRMHFKYSVCLIKRQNS